jgi:hypothetical protein
MQNTNETPHLQVDYSKRALLKFLEFAAANGLMQPATVNARQVAVSRLLTDLTDSEAADVRTIDVNLAAQKLANRSGNDISAETLAAYRRRAAIAIDEFVEWMENPAEYQPRGFSRRWQHQPSPEEIDHLRRGQHQPTPEEIDHLREARGGGRGEHGGRHGGRGRGMWGGRGPGMGGIMGGRPGMSNGLPLSFPLRPDFLAQVVVPRDLTVAEAKRLSAFLLTLASDYEPTV